MAKHLICSKYIAIVLTLAAIQPVELHASPSDLEYVRVETIGVLGEGLKAIKSVSNSKEREIISNIEVDVPINPAPVWVLADEKDGKPIIELSTGYSAIVRMIISGYVMENILNSPGFGDKYARYTAQTYATGKLDGGMSPWRFAELSKSDKAKLLNSKEFNAIQQGQYVITLWYVLAHEIAHHVLGHVSDKKVSKQLAREQEQMADDWATNTLIKLGMPPAMAFPSLMYWYYLDEYGVLTESLRRHPPDLKRVRKMLKATISEFDTWNSNEMYFKSVQKKQALLPFMRYLTYVEESISEQTDFSAIEKTSEFEKCMNNSYESCLLSCQARYKHSLSQCKSIYCVSERSEKIWKLRCKDRIELSKVN